MYVVKAPGPSPLPHSPGAGGRGWLPKLFDHTLSSDISQYNHFSISSAPNFAIITMHDHGELFRLIYGVTEVMSAADLGHALDDVDPDLWSVQWNMGEKDTLGSFIWRKSLSTLPGAVVGHDYGIVLVLVLSVKDRLPNSSLRERLGRWLWCARRGAALRAPPRQGGGRPPGTSQRGLEDRGDLGLHLVVGLAGPCLGPGGPAALLAGGGPCQVWSNPRTACRAGCLEWVTTMRRCNAEDDLRGLEASARNALCHAR